VDEVILAAARAEAARRPREAERPRWSWFAHWQPLAATAGVAGLAFVLLQLMPGERDVERPVTIEATAPEGPPVQSAAESAPVAAPTEPASREEPESSSKAAESSPAPPTGVPSPPPVLQSGGTPPETGAAVPADRGDASATAVEVPTAASSMPSTERAESPMERDSGLAVPSPSEWAGRIESLHDSGDLDRAADELRAFRLAWPDADDHLPPDLRPWAASVR
jgi:hypothetical protein